MDGQDVEEAKSVGGEMQRVTVHKYDNMMALKLLAGLGALGKDIVRGGKVGKGAGAKGGPVPKPVPGVDGAPVEVAPVGENVDTVLFADRATAFKAMGCVPAEGKGG